ncbi:DoxX family protein [Nocardia sp. 004]|uniref:DoxX family protein n=1 Tax=Nocardia sp. 004 TaxID=3385978 RepID=UPI0039A2831C
MELFRRPEQAEGIPRTEEELGLDPDVPVVGADKTDPRHAGANGAEDSQAEADQPASTYEYASIPPAPTLPKGSVRVPPRKDENRRGTVDFGLFLLRLVLGGTFIYHGLQKLTGWFHGPGLDGTRDMLADGGWDNPTLSTTLVTVGELGGGILLVLGLGTPFAAGAVLAVVLDAWAWKQGMVPGLQYKAGPGAVELESVLAGLAVAIILIGPGRWSFDRNRGWATRPFIGSFVILLLAIAAAVGVYWYLHGGNPFSGIGPFD